MSHSGPLLVLPQHLEVDGCHFIAAPSESEFKAQFGSFLPAAQFLTSAYGTTAYYYLPAKGLSPETPIQRLIFIHGVGTPAVGLAALSRKLQASNPNLHILLYDLWGHGLSQTPLVPHVPAIFHFQILHLLSHMKWSSAHVVGYSFGGTTAASFAAFHPEAIESLTLIAPVGLLCRDDLSQTARSLLLGGPGVEEAARDWVLNMSEGGPLVVPENWKERVHRGELVPDAIKSWQRVHHKGHVTSLVAIFRDGDVFNGHEAFRTVAKSGKKTMAMLGEFDALCSLHDLNAVGWRNVFTVKNAGHGLVRDDVDDVAALLQDFWTTSAEK